MQIKIIYFISFFLSFHLTSIGCSGFKLTVGAKTMVGLNEDFWNPNTIMWTKKATVKTHGAVFFGYVDSPRESGINDQGLIFDVFTTPTRKTKPQGGIKLLESNIQSFKENLLLSCGTVSEAINYLKKFNLEIINGVQLFIADKEGNSIVVEVDTIIKPFNNYQIVTNFNQSRISQNSPVTCERYIAGNQILSNSQEFSLDYGKKLLKAMQDTIGTQYSQIFDLSTGTIHLFLYHNYNEEVILNVSDLTKQEINKPIQSYFKDKNKYLLFYNNFETTKRIAGKMTITTPIKILEKYIDTLISLPNSLPQLFADSLIKLGIQSERFNDSSKSEIIHNSFSKFTFKVKGYPLFEYYEAVIELNKNNLAEAKQHIDIALKKRPDNKDFLLLKTEIDMKISLKK